MPLPAIAGGLLIGGLVALFSGKDKSQESQYCQHAGQGSNHLLGTLGGGAAGAVVGSAICPGLGTVIGGVLGALFGREVSKQFSQDQCCPQPQHGNYPPPGQGNWGPQVPQGNWCNPGYPQYGGGPQFGGFPQTGGYCCPPQPQYCQPQQCCPPQNCCPPQPQCPPQQGGQQDINWGGTLQQDGKGKPATYTTSGGYNITMNGDRVSITDCEGNKVEHWGDPHENVNGKHVKDWNEKTRTLILADGTKVTMNATGPQGVTESTSIYDGAQNIQFNNKNNTVEHRSFDPWDTAGRERTQADGETSYMGYARNGDLIYRNIYTQKDNLQVIPSFQDLARVNGGKVTDLYDDPRLGHT